MPLDFLPLSPLAPQGIEALDFSDTGICILAAVNVTVYFSHYKVSDKKKQWKPTCFSRSGALFWPSQMHMDLQTQILKCDKSSHTHTLINTIFKVKRKKEYKGIKRKMNLMSQCFLYMSIFMYLCKW